MRYASPGGAGTCSGIFERIARDAQGCSSLADFRVELLKALQREVGADSGSLMDPPGTRSKTVEAAMSRMAGVGTTAAIKGRFLAGLLRYVRSGHRLLYAMDCGNPVIDSDVYTARDRERLAVYDEILVPQGARSLLCAIVHYRGRPISWLTLKRHAGVTPYRSGDVAVLRQLLPVVAFADAGFQYSLGAQVTNAENQQRDSGTPLSCREAQVAALVCKGMYNAEIAALLGTSRETVKKQVQSVLEKVGVSNRTELAGIWMGSSTRMGAP